MGKTKKERCLVPYEENMFKDRLVAVQVLNEWTN